MIILGVTLQILIEDEKPNELDYPSSLDDTFVGVEHGAGVDDGIRGTQNCGGVKGVAFGGLSHDPFPIVLSRWILHCTGQYSFGIPIPASTSQERPLFMDEQLPSNIGAKRGRPKKGLSNVWLFFTKYGDSSRFEDKRQKVLTMGTPNNNLDCGDEMKNVKSNLVVVEFDKKGCRKACTRMIIVDELPFSFVEKEGFRDFCRVVCQRLLEDDGHCDLYFSEFDDGKKSVGPPKEDDWSNAKVFVQFLHVFYDTTLKFCASLSITSNMFFHELCLIPTELTTLASSGDFLLCKMVAAMKSKFDKYWGKIENVNKLLIITLVFYPRYMLDYVKFCFGDLFDDSKVNEMTYDIKEFLIKLYEFYKGADNFQAVIKFLTPFLWQMRVMWENQVKIQIFAWKDLRRLNK
ncbi:hypothetical protein EZV62_004269 [Acer yangbiense]|uniref:hAT-like transposase RNase-H fold domain-containing protein n=1 Tax=Acer yangbiense TaxID=1000413 RepID=A0A5C7IKC5_9ROSI|nr:hypothetical protein EZV62_004269 [Acer yangbiense]